MFKFKNIRDVNIFDWPIDQIEKDLCGLNPQRKSQEFSGQVIS